MNKKDLFDLYYKTFVSLYGVIDSVRAYEIIFYYHPEIDEDDFLKDLEKRSYKEEVHYYGIIRSDADGVYLICDESFFVEDNYEDEIDKCIDAKRTDDYYFMEDSEEDYFKYSLMDYLPFHPMNDDILQRISSLFKKDSHHDPIDIMLDVMSICSLFEETNYSLILQEFKRMRLKLNRSNMDFVIELIDDIAYISRNWYLNGFTQEETDFRECFTLDENDVLHISEITKENIKNLNLDYKALIAAVEKLDFPKENIDLLKEEIIEASKKIVLN